MSTRRRAIAARLAACSLLVAAGCGPGPADAADPMRPLAAPGGGAAPAGPGVPAAPASAASDVPRPGAPLLAIRADGPQQRRALFGERWVHVGERLDGGWTVGAIDALAVRLVAPGGRRSHTLYLLPPLQYAPAPAAETRSSP